MPCPLSPPRLIAGKFACCVAFAISFLSIAANASGQTDTMSLAGEWQFRLGGPTEGEQQEALKLPSFTDHIHLPGTTDTEQKGTPNGYHSTESLSQPYRYEGTCWYQREITFPSEWSGKTVTLTLERTKYTQVWLDGKPLGVNPIICSPQEYRLTTNAVPGKHTLTIVVDNKRLPPYGADAHQTSGNTQGNWNGIIGKINLRATDAISISSVIISTKFSRRMVDVKIELNNTTSSPKDVQVNFDVLDARHRSVATKKVVANSLPGSTQAHAEIELGSGWKTWDEFHPNLFTLQTSLKGPGVSDSESTQFGCRDFRTSNHQFTINGRTTFLRGRHDGCVFPLTGHPPMDVEGWLKYFKICREYGLNHVRFHTWTPPDAAFEAADRMGFYLQTELPFWGNFDQKAAVALKPEAIQIQKYFGNHPSFVMFSMGNEHWGTIEVLNKLVGELKALDPRHLYVRGTNAISWQGHPGENDDYLVTADVHDAKGKAIRVRAANAGENRGQVQVGPANTETDYAEATATTDLPVVTHEMGQFTTFPDFAEIKKYKGVSKPYNLEFFQKRLEAAGMMEQDVAFCKASGALAALCYREEIEACLRTPQHGGFELLDLQDYPGQGTALVGVLDAFMQSKGGVTPEQWRQFCNPVVILAKFPKYVWSKNELFEAKVQVAQYGPTDLSSPGVEWKLVDKNGAKVASGISDSRIHVPQGKLPSIPTGGLRSFEDISLPLSTTGQYKLELQIVGTNIKTSYPIWVYDKNPIVPSMSLKIAQSFDQGVVDTLQSGGRVLLVTDKRPMARSVGGGFATDFWCFPMFHDKPGTMGILCNPNHPALKGFPTASHSDWQWFNINLASQPLVLDDLLPNGKTPIVQVIDNIERDHKLGTVFEFKVGKGSLLVCTSDLIGLGKNHPEAAQLLASLVEYASSEAFKPTVETTVEKLRPLFQCVMPSTGWVASASSFDDNWKGYRPSQIVDGNESKVWRASPSATGPQWCQIDFPTPMDLHDGEIVWGDDKQGYSYVMESTVDGKSWSTLSDQTSNSLKGSIHRLKFAALGVKAVRVRILGTPNNEPASIGEVRFYAE